MREIWKKSMRRIASCALAVMMACSMLPATALAALETGETQQITVLVVYSDGGYVNLGKYDYTCAMTTGHSGYNHSIAYKDIYSLSTTVSNSIKSGYDIETYNLKSSFNITYPTQPLPYSWASGSAATTTSYYLVFGAEAQAVSTTYTLSYNANGGTNTPAASTMTTTNSYADIQVTSSEPTRDGYIFTGWNTSAYGTGASYSAGNYVTVTGTTTLYAQWEEIKPETYTLTFDLDGGSWSNRDDDAVSFEFEEKAEIPFSNYIPEKDGYKFVEWQRDAFYEDGIEYDNVTYGPNYTFYMPGEDVGLTAIWEKVDTTWDLTLNYINNGVTIDTFTDSGNESGYVIYKSAESGPADTGTDNVVFAGWQATSSNGSLYIYDDNEYRWVSASYAAAEGVAGVDSTVYQPGDEVVATSGEDDVIINLSAQWEDDLNNNGTADKDETKYTVTYTDGVEDEELFEDQVISGILEGTDTPEFDGTPERDGHVFNGWDPELAKTVTETVTYKATWGEDKNNNGKDDATEDKFTITYTDGAEGTVFDNVVFEVLVDLATPSFGEDPTREGYIFTGWDPEVADDVTADATYAATWGEDKNNNGIDDATEEKFTITYTDGAEGTVFDNVVFEVLVDLATPSFGEDPTREGYIFTGWEPEVADTVGADTTYVATWAEDGDGDDTTGGDADADSSDSSSDDSDDKADSASSDDDSKDKLAKTGDSSNVFTVAATMAVALGGLVLARRKLLG